MKSLLLSALLLLPLPALAEDSITDFILANEPDFLVLHDRAQAAASVFLSYTGPSFNHCGIALRAHSFAAGPERLKDLLQIELEGAKEESIDVTEMRGMRLVGALPQSMHGRYGAYFTVKTRSGRPLRDVLAEGADGARNIRVIVEILACEGKR